MLEEAIKGDRRAPEACLLLATLVREEGGDPERASWLLGQAKKLTVPPAAVLRRGEVTAVYVLDDKGTAKLRQVRLGEAVAGGELEVLAGINSGERVSLTPLKTGIELKAAPAAAAR
jgi:hypothetical protein